MLGRSKSQTQVGGAPARPARYDSPQSKLGGPLKNAPHGSILERKRHFQSGVSETTPRLSVASLVRAMPDRASSQPPKPNSIVSGVRSTAPLSPLLRSRALGGTDGRKDSLIVTGRPPRSASPVSRSGAPGGDRCNMASANSSSRPCGGTGGRTASPPSRGQTISPIGSRPRARPTASPPRSSHQNKPPSPLSSCRSVARVAQPSRGKSAQAASTSSPSRAQREVSPRPMENANFSFGDSVPLYPRTPQSIGKKGQEMPSPEGIDVASFPLVPKSETSLDVASKAQLVAELRASEMAQEAAEEEHWGLVEEVQMLRREIAYDQELRSRTQPRYLSHLSKDDIAVDSGLEDAPVKRWKARCEEIEEKNRIFLTKIDKLQRDRNNQARAISDRRTSAQSSWEWRERCKTLQKQLETIGRKCEAGLNEDGHGGASTSSVAARKSPDETQDLKKVHNLLKAKKAQCERLQAQHDTMERKLKSCEQQDARDVAMREQAEALQVQLQKRGAEEFQEDEKAQQLRERIKEFEDRCNVFQNDRNILRQQLWVAKKTSQNEPTEMRQPEMRTLLPPTFEEVSPELEEQRRAVRDARRNRDLLLEKVAEVERMRGVLSEAKKTMAQLREEQSELRASLREIRRLGS